MKADIKRLQKSKLKSENLFVVFKTLSVLINLIWRCNLNKDCLNPQAQQESFPKTKKE